MSLTQLEMESLDLEKHDTAHLVGMGVSSLPSSSSSMG